MAGIDGFEFLNSLKALELESEEITKFNIVMLSASLSQKHKKIAASFGDLLKGCFLKPLDETLLEKILPLISYNEEFQKQGGFTKGEKKKLPSGGN